MENKKDLTKEDYSIIRAKIEPNTSESNDFDFSCIAVPTNNGQVRYSWQNDEKFMQVLKTGIENINIERMNSGLPIFDNHPEIDDISVTTTLGITVGYEFVEEGILMRCKLGARADEALRNDIKNGIVKTVSIEGTIQRYLIVRTKENEIPTYYAEFWTPQSLSFAPVPNDIEAQIEVKRAKIEKEKQKTEVKKNTSFINKLINKF